MNRPTESEDNLRTFLVEIISWRELIEKWRFLITGAPSL